MGMKVGLQLFSIKEAMKENPLEAIRKAAECGYRYIEVANHNALEDMGIGFGVKAEEVNKLLKDVGASIVSAHIYPFDKEKYKYILEYNAEIGNQNIIYPMGRFKDMDDVLNQCEMLNEYGEMTRKYGMKFYYHNHANEFMTVERKLIMDVIMDNTDADKVGFELDTFWAMRGGIDPVEYIRKYQDRIGLLHQKDMAKGTDSPINVFSRLTREVSEENIAAFRYCKQYVKPEDFTEIGRGIMDIQEIIDTANEIGKTEYIILEQDYTGMESEIESIRCSMQEFKKFRGIEWE